MPPLSPMALIQQAIYELITIREPAFITIALYWADRFAIVLIIVEALKGAGSSGAFQDRWFRLIQTCFFIVLTRTMLVFYDVALPGTGTSFSNIVTDASSYLVNLLDADAIQNMFGHLDLIWSRMIMPSYLAWFAMAIYLLLLVVIFFAKGVIIFIIVGSYVAAAVCGLVGPLFIPFLMWRPMSWLFWGWLRAYIQYAFVPVIAIAYMMVFEQFIGRFTTTLPANIGVSAYPTYLYVSIIMIGSMALNIKSVPGLTASIFSGHMHQGDHGGGILYTLLLRR